MTERDLTAVERAAGAVFGSEEGVELPRAFAGVEAECRSVRETAGLIDLGFRGRLRFVGDDRTAFLHNLLSNDVKSLVAGTGCYALMLTQQSRLVADADVLCAEDAIFLDLDLRMKDKAREHLEKYLVADDVEIEDRFADEATLGVHGPRSVDVLREATGETPPEAELAHRTTAARGVPVRIVRNHRTGDVGFDLWVARPQAGALWAALSAAGRSFGLAPVGSAALEALRVEAGRARVGVDVDDSNLALESGLERGIHFRKGCYLGQEIVERQAARGHVNRKLSGLFVEGRAVPARGSRIVEEEREVGRVTSAVWSPTLGRTIALAVVRREVMVPGQRLAIESGSDNLAAEVVDLPFYRPAASSS